MNKPKGASKSSDEILNELFDSLNLPITPKPLENTIKRPNSNECSPLEEKFSCDEITDSEYASSGSTDQEIDKLLEEVVTVVSENSKVDQSFGISHNKKDKKKKKKKLKKTNGTKSKHKKRKKKKSHKVKDSFNTDGECENKVKDSKKLKELDSSNKGAQSCDTDKDISVKKSKRKRSHSYSHSRSRSRSCTKKPNNSKSRSRSCSKKIKHSRSRSYSKKAQHSRSKSKSICPKTTSSSSKLSNYKTRSRSRSISRRNGSHRSRLKHSSRSLSHSPSPKRHQKEGYTKLKSRSPVKKGSKEPLDAWKTAKLASLKKNSLATKPDIEIIDSTPEFVSSLSKQEIEKEKLPIGNIPLPIQESESETSKTPVVVPLELQSDKTKKELNIVVPSVEDISALNSSDHSTSQTILDSATKGQEKIKDEGKGKVIVIKSLKDSVVFQQAEEAQKKPRSDDENLLENNLQPNDKTGLNTETENSKEIILDIPSLSHELDSKVDSESCNTKSSKFKDKKKKHKLEEEMEESPIEDSLSNSFKKLKKDENTNGENENGKDIESKGLKKMDDKKIIDISRSRSRSRLRSTSRPKATARDGSKKINRSRSKSKIRKRRSRSSSRPKRKRSRSKEKYRKRSRSHSRTRRSTSRNRYRRRSRSRSMNRMQNRGGGGGARRMKRSVSREKRKSPDCVDSLRDKATRKRLLEVARKNAVYLMKNNCLPPSIEKESVRATGKSVEELTSFCQKLVSKEYSDAELSDPSLSPDERDIQFDKPFGGSGARHPYAIKDCKPIMMNIRNGPMLPLKSNAERLADTSKLREQFPVSSGSQHRTVAESGWVPVEKDETKKGTVFPEPPSHAVDISQLVSNRLNAMRRLQDNPTDKDAMKALNSVKKEMQSWALSKQIPGQFTGSTGAKILSQEELNSGYQAWARKEQFKEAKAVTSQFGLKMLQKMGWNPGEGLGKYKKGQIEPLLLDVKMDKKGLKAQDEMTPRRAAIPLARSLAGKHPVSALLEICSKRKWNPPDFEIVFDSGPDHKKNFLMKVHVNNQTYKSAIAASTKKIAKANAAAACLQALGLIPKDPPAKATGTLNTSQQSESEAVPAGTEQSQGDDVSQQPEEMQNNEQVVAQYSTTENAQYSTTENAQYSTTENAQYSTTENAQYSTAENAQYSTTENAQYSTTENAQYSTTENAQEAIARYGTDAMAQYSSDGTQAAMAQYSTDGAQMMGQYNTDGSQAGAQYSSDGTQMMGQYNTDGSQAVAQYSSDGTQMMGQYNTDGSQAVAQYSSDGTHMMGQYNTDGSQAVAQYSSDGTHMMGQYNTDDSQAAAHYSSDGSQMGQYNTDGSQAVAQYSSDGTHLSQYYAGN